MTRFARAKGSKASNEKAPEDGTPWEVMKEQLLRAKQDSDEAKKREEAEKQRIDNYENFLKEQKISKRKATWCDFPEAEHAKNNSVQNVASPAKKKKKNKTKPMNNNVLLQIIEKDNDEEVSNGDRKKKNKQKNNNHEVFLNTDETNINGEVTTPEPTTKKNKKSLASISEGSEIKSLPVETTSPKKKKKKQKQSKSVQEGEKTEVSSNNTDDNVNNTIVAKNNSNNIKQNINSNKNKKKKKIQANGEPIRRKAINDHSFQLIINGKEVELIRFEGFPVMKKDAERLQELKTSMSKKGIPKSEVQRTIKLERRRAEKALARMKREVCYNCRKGGHNLSDCPELKSKIPGVDGANDGVCFKCGSTEHRQFECKVQRDKEFRFATCFICKEQGHIARQCPDNPKGLYPNGGGCKLCGDVTHLKKDCPTTKDQKEETSVKLQTLDDGNIEDIGHKQKNVIPEETNKKPKKIKF